MKVFSFDVVVLCVNHASGMTKFYQEKDIDEGIILSNYKKSFANRFFNSSHSEHRQMCVSHTLNYEVKLEFNNYIGSDYPKIILNQV